MKKTVALTIFVGIVGLVGAIMFSWLVNVLFPQLIQEYKNPQLFRAWTDPIMSLYYLHPFILAMILVWLWKKLHTLIHGKSLFERALRFALLFWLITNTPGMLMTYSSFPFSFLMVASWSMSSLIECIIMTLVIIKLDKNYDK